MAINGTHMLFYTSEAEKLRAMLRDAFGFKHVDAGGGWLIFALPPAEVGVHPAEGPTFDSGVRHQISFMCDDIHKTIAELRAKGVEVLGEPKTERYGHTITLRLPGGCDVMMYQPLHAIAADIKKPKASKKRSATKKAAAKKNTKKKVS
jgi:catechol 2,3-dioxygenase-like lactoylglutathione lyase family enzyme